MIHKLHYERTDYSVAVKNRAQPPKAWRWEIYRAGNSLPIKQSSIYFDTMAGARRAGKEALKHLLDKLFENANAPTPQSELAWVVHYFDPRANRVGTSRSHLTAEGAMRNACDLVQHGCRVDFIAGPEGNDRIEAVAIERWCRLHPNNQRPI